MLDGTNPIVLKTALEQFQKFRRGDPELLLTLRPLLDHPESGIREDAARLIGQIVARHAGEEVPEEAELRGELIAAARRDPATPVRIWATVALGAFADAAAEEVLEEISESDPEQNVRYAAEKTLLERRKRASGGGFD
jgi:HEAT repeat protein